MTKEPIATTMGMQAVDEKLTSMTPSFYWTWYKLHGEYLQYRNGRMETSGFCKGCHAHSTSISVYEQAVRRPRKA